MWDRSANPSLTTHSIWLKPQRGSSYAASANGKLCRRLRAALFAAVTCSPLCAQAADATAVRVRQTSGVVMMIGGMASADDTVTQPKPVASVQSVIPSAASSRLSVVMQPRTPLSAATMPPQASASVASRVMALSPMINEAARAANVDSALLMAMIDVESGGNSQAVSPKGATGLMQLMPGTGARHGATNLFDPRQNVAAGARYLKQLMRQFGDLQLVLAAYNAGEGAVQKYGGQIPPYAETMSYVPKVIARYRQYRDAMPFTGEASAQVGSGSTHGGFLLVRSDAGD